MSKVAFPKYVDLVSKEQLKRRRHTGPVIPMGT
jgi:hypothetical protein